MLPNDLSEWLSDTGGVIVDRRAAGAALSPIEQVVYEIWLLDTQKRNGGLSQYFCNCGAEQWRQCIATANDVGLSSFALFATQVDALIAGAKDPYKVLIKQGRVGDDIYDEHSNRIVRELREKYLPVA